MTDKPALVGLISGSFLTHLDSDYVSSVRDSSLVLHVILQNRDTGSLPRHAAADRHPLKTATRERARAAPLPVERPGVTGTTLLMVDCLLARGYESVSRVYSHL
jgi:hypothetical protein